MGSKILFKWSKLITSSQVEQLIRAEKDINRALKIFDSATAEYGNGFRHDQKTFGVMIYRLVSINLFRRAEEMLDRMKDEKCKVTEDIFLTIFKAYGRIHKPLDAVRVFHKMEDFHCGPTHKSYITVFSILVEENHLKEALSFYRYMREMGITTTTVSLNVLIKALCKNAETVEAALRIFREMPHRGCPPDSYTYGTLINGLCRLGRIDDAKALFREMEKQVCSPSVVTYSSLIHGLCQSNNLDEAKGLLEEMKGKGVDPNVFTYSSLMDGFCKRGCSLQAMELLNLMVQQRLLPNMITYSTLINGLCKEDKLHEAVEILDRMKLQGLKPDAGLYGKIITSFCATKNFQQAVNFLDEMVLSRISPNRLTWSLHVRMHNIVVIGLSAMDIRRTFQLYLSMRTRGISVESVTYNHLVKSFITKRDLQKALRILDEMVADGCTPHEEIWSAVVIGYLDQRKVRETTDLMLEGLKSDFFDANEH